MIERAKVECRNEKVGFQVLLCCTSLIILHDFGWFLPVASARVENTKHAPPSSRTIPVCFEVVKEKSSNESNAP